MIPIIKFLLRHLLKLLYRVEVTGLENYHKAGDKVLIIANHTSLLDAALLYAWLPGNPAFVINSHIAKKKKFVLFLLFAELFPIERNSALSIKSMVKFLTQNKKLIVFPEGKITTTGSLMKIYHGPGLIADKSAAAVLPIGIYGPQFSSFSYLNDQQTKGWFPRIRITILPPVIFSIDKNIQGTQRKELLTAKMQDIMYLLSYNAFKQHTTVFNAVLDTASRYRKNRLVIEDINRQPCSYTTLLTKTFTLGSVIHTHTDNQYIGIMMPNTVANVVLFLASQSVARIPVMINFTTNIEAILKSCETAKLDTIYTSRQFIEVADLSVLINSLQEKMQIRYLEDIAQGISLFDKFIGRMKALFPRIIYHRISKNISAESPAVILFTSGSEGSPKGVVLSHSNILASTAQFASQFSFRPQDLFFSCLPLFHVFGINIGCLLPLLVGSRVFLYASPLHYKAIPELIYELEATALFGTNTFLREYARHAHPFDFHSLRYVGCGAEKMHEETQQIWMEKFGIRIYQGYGQTETSGAFSVNNPIHNKPNSIGRPLPAIEYSLAQVEGIKEGGQLFVKGPNVMSGYLPHTIEDNNKIHLPECTNGEGWYDTGDIVKIDNDGYFYVLGRAKRFAKIAGEMVSLTAVENLAIKVWPDFNHAAINLLDSQKGEKIILITDHKNALKKDLQQQMKQDGYSALHLPKEILHYQVLPVLSSGKTDYAQLMQTLKQ